MASPSDPILIVGGGIGGFSAALALARKSIPVTILEQAPEFQEVGAGLQMGPNAFKMFDRLGLTGMVARTAVYPNSLLLMDAISGERVFEVPIDEAFRSDFGHSYAVMHRADLLDCFVEACRDHDLVQLEPSTKITDFEQDENGVTAAAEDGRSFRGRALIGCDGIWSVVRNRLVGPDAPRITGHIAYRAVLPIGEVPEHLRSNSVVLWAGPKLHLAHYPLRNGELFNMGAIFHSMRYEAGWDSYGDPEELHERFDGTCDAVQTLLGKIEEWRMWVLRDRDPIRDWSDGLVTLLGDSAHPTLQYMAQGACMAIEDAVCLANIVAGADDLKAAFLEYERTRYLRTARIQLTSRYYGEIYHAEGVERDLRNDVMAKLTPENFRRNISWLYDGI